HRIAGGSERASEKVFDQFIDSIRFANIPEHSRRQVVSQTIGSEVVTGLGAHEPGAAGMERGDRAGEVFDAAAPRGAGQVVVPVDDAVILTDAELAHALFQPTVDDLVNGEPAAEERGG